MQLPFVFNTFYMVFFLFKRYFTLTFAFTHCERPSVKKRVSILEQVYLGQSI